MSDKAKKYYIKTYGCAMNYSDAEKISAWYREKGWKQAKEIEDADEIVIVTCSVRQTAEDRVYGLVKNIISYKQSAISHKPKIVLTGCMLRYPLKYLKGKLPQVDEFKKISEYFPCPSYPSGSSSSPKALIPIMEGCNNFCSYCVVPYARGREISRPTEEIICEVGVLAKRGVKEITLLGQNVNSYRPPNIPNIPNIPDSPFAVLLTRLQRLEGIEKISFLTSNPWDLTDDIIKAMKLPKIDRYLHLPVQSGDDEILRKMNRHYSAEDYIRLVEKIRKKIPDIKIGTDIIVGFPGETEEKFNNTVLLCRKVGFVKAYVSMYSPRLQTTAYKLEDTVPHKEKRRRWKILEDLINK